MIVLPNGFNVFPEDIENALRVAGHPRLGRPRDRARSDRGGRPRAGRAWRPGRRSVADGRGAFGDPDEDLGAAKARIDAAVKAANATLAVHARVAAWRFWPDEDFPRTHTLKIKRDQVRGLGRRRRTAPGDRRRLTDRSAFSG